MNSYDGDEAKLCTVTGSTLGAHLLELVALSYPAVKHSV